MSGNSLTKKSSFSIKSTFWGRRKLILHTGHLQGHTGQEQPSIWWKSNFGGTCRGPEVGLWWDFWGNPLVKFVNFTKGFPPYTNFGTPARYPKIRSSPNRRLFRCRMFLEVNATKYELPTTSKSWFNRKKAFFSSIISRSQWESQWCLGSRSLNFNN